MTDTSHANIRFRIMKQAVAPVGLGRFSEKCYCVLHSITKSFESNEENSPDRSSNTYSWEYLTWKTHFTDSLPAYYFAVKGYLLPISLKRVF